MTDKGLPLRFASAISSPHRSAICESIVKIRPAKRAWRSSSSQASSCVRRLLCDSPATPFRISPNVKTLKKSKSSGAACIQARTSGSGLVRINSEMQFVSSKNPLTVRHLDPGFGRAPNPSQLLRAETPGKIARYSLAGGPSLRVCRTALETP